MDKNRINEMVDRKIIESFRDNISIGAVQSDLKVRIQNFTKTITKDGASVIELSTKEFSEINPIRHRYGITYIKQCQKRISDLDWIFINKPKFNNFNNSKLFDLIKFKEKIS